VPKVIKIPSEAKQKKNCKVFFQVWESYYEPRGDCFISISERNLKNECSDSDQKLSDASLYLKFNDTNDDAKALQELIIL
jgi:hypothetical protein